MKLDSPKQRVEQRVMPEKVVDDKGNLIIIFPTLGRPGVRKCEVYGPGSWDVNTKTPTRRGVARYLDDKGKFVGEFYEPSSPASPIGRKSKEVAEIRTSVTSLLANIADGSSASLNDRGQGSYRFELGKALELIPYAGVKVANGKGSASGSDGSAGSGEVADGPEFDVQHPIPPDETIGEIGDDLLQFYMDITRTSSREPLPEWLQELVDKVVLPPSN